MAYTDVEVSLYDWFRKKGLFPGKLGIGDVQDLAERISNLISPFRNKHRASEGWQGYDLDTCNKEAKEAEKNLLSFWDKAEELENFIRADYLRSSPPGHPHRKELEKLRSAASLAGKTYPPGHPLHSHQDCCK